MKRLLSTLCLLALFPSCKWERTVYDEYGNPVVESDDGEKSLESVMEGRFNASFSEHRNKDGVPESASDRVSQYQRDIDAARKEDKVFSTRSYTGFNKTSDIRSKSFADSGKTFDRNKTYDTGKNSTFSRDLRPDFLNESHGLAHTEYSGAKGRSSWEGQGSKDSGRKYETHASQYKAGTPSSYVSSRESKTPQPKIIDHRDQGKKNIDETRHLMGRDEIPR